MIEMLKKSIEKNLIVTWTNAMYIFPDVGTKLLILSDFDFFDTFGLKM